MGRRLKYRPGSYYQKDDRTGFPERVEDTVEEWNGLVVSHKVAEERHPQDFVEGVADDQSVDEPRPLPQNAFAGPVFSTLTKFVYPQGNALAVDDITGMAPGVRIGVMLDSGIIFETFVVLTGTPISTIWGFQTGGEGYIAAAHNMNTPTFRLGWNDAVWDYTPLLKYVHEVSSTIPPIKLAPNIKHRPNGGNEDSVLVPLEDIPAYQAKLATIFDAFAPVLDILSIENEVNGGEFGAHDFLPEPIGFGASQAKYDEYIAAITAVAVYFRDAYYLMLRAAVDVAHSTGDYAGQGRNMLIADAGVSSSGMSVAYDYHIFLTTGEGESLRGNPREAYNAIMSTLLFEGAASTGVDFLNVHFFVKADDELFPTQQAALAYVRSLTTLPIAMLAIGQKNDVVEDVTLLGQLIIDNVPARASVFSGLAANTAYPYVNAQGERNELGMALSAIIASVSGTPFGVGIDPPLPTGASAGNLVTVYTPGVVG